jgi:glutathione synthase/RimK-type ligase-like ATP-grasp enzyme
MSDEGLKFAREEWRAALEATYILMRQPLWVSHPDRLREAARKPLQLVLAQQLGFTVPSTLITNEPSLAKDFIQQCNEKVIVKPTGAGWVYSQDNVAVTYVLTNRVQQQDIDDLNKIKTAPITLQEEIVKAYEIRVNVVGQEVLPIKIDSQRSERSQVDWRRYDVSKTPYTPYQLPIDIQLACLKLTKLLGLEFGAIDLIRQPDGEYIFLEINGNGQFLWAEELSGVNVGDALALLLTGIAPPLRLANLE